MPKYNWQAPLEHLLHIITLLLLLLLLLTTVLVCRLLVVSALAARVIPAMMANRLRRQRRRHIDAPARQVNVYAALVLFGGAVQAELLAEALDGGLDLLDVADRVVPLADDDVQVALATGLGVADARLEDALGLLHELAVQVDGVLGHVARRVVLAEDVLGRLLVVRVTLRLVLLALVGQGLGAGAVAMLVGLVRLQHVVLSTSGDFTTVVEDTARGRQKGADQCTRSKHELIFPASCRARSRRRSYSASASLFGLWLKATRV